MGDRTLRCPPKGPPGVASVGGPRGLPGTAHFQGFATLHATSVTSKKMRCIFSWSSAEKGLTGFHHKPRLSILILLAVQPNSIFAPVAARNIRTSFGLWWPLVARPVAASFAVAVVAFSSFLNCSTNSTNGCLRNKASMRAMLETCSAPVRVAKSSVAGLRLINPVGPASGWGTKRGTIKCCCAIFQSLCCPSTICV